MQGIKKGHSASETCRTQIDHRHYELSRSAKQRLKWMEHFSKYRNARFTCRHFGISPDTFYLWKKRFIPSNLNMLEDNFKTRRPHTMRPSKHIMTYLEIIKKLKKTNPKLGRIKIAKILAENGPNISSSTISRILKTVRD